MCSRTLWLLSLALALIGAAPAHGAGGRPKVFLTQEEALKLAFDGCQVKRVSSALTADHKRRIEKLGGSKFPRSLAISYVARKDGKLVGTAYFDVHRVRTLRQTLMVVVDPAGRIRRIELLAFGEPRDYIPRASWYAQFKGARLDDRLSLKRGIKGVTGATLTARATVAAARRLLALHHVLGQQAADQTR